MPMDPELGDQHVTFENEECHVLILGIGGLQPSERLKVDKKFAERKGEISSPSGGDSFIASTRHRIRKSIFSLYIVPQLPGVLGSMGHLILI